MHAGKADPTQNSAEGGKKGSQNSDNLNDNSEEGGKSYHLRTDEQLEPLYAAEAKRRSGERTDLRQISDEGSYGRTDEQLAKLAAEAGNPVAVQVRDGLRSGEKKSDEYRESASQNSDAPKVRTDEQLAKLAGTSRDTIRKVRLKKKGDCR